MLKKSTPEQVLTKVTILVATLEARVKILERNQRQRSSRLEGALLTNEKLRARVAELEQKLHDYPSNSHERLAVVVQKARVAKLEAADASMKEVERQVLLRLGNTRAALRDCVKVMEKPTHTCPWSEWDAALAAARKLAGRGS